MSEQNLIKLTSKQLGLTYKELAQAIGYGEGAVKNSSSTNNISEPMRHAIKMYKRILELENELKKANQIKQTFKEWVNG